METDRPGSFLAPAAHLSSSKGDRIRIHPGYVTYKVARHGVARLATNHLNEEQDLSMSTYNATSATDSDVVTSAMFRRSLRSPAAEREWIESCLAGNGLTEEEWDAQVAHRMACHAARCAWSEIEYRAAIAGDAAGAGSHRESPPAERVAELLQVAYAADAAASEALSAVREAESRAEYARRSSGARPGWAEY